MWTLRECWCDARKHNVSTWRAFFTCVPVGLDAWWRKSDFSANRSVGGKLARLGMDGYPPLALVLPSVAVFWMVNGPMVTSGSVGVWLLVAAGLVVLFGGSRIVVRRNRSLILFQVVWITIIGAIVWVAGTGHAQSEQRIYRHFLPFAYVLVIAVPLEIARWLGGWVFSDVGPNCSIAFRRLLEEVDLFVKPQYPLATGRSIVRSLIGAPLEYPLHLIFFPACVVLLVPYVFRDWLTWIAIATFVLTWLALSFAEVESRLDEMLHLITRTLFVGGQAVVSLSIIVLAAGRLLEIDYVTTVIESSSMWLVVSYILCGYTLFWFYEYWINETITRRLLDLLRAPGDPPYQAQYAIPAAAKTTAVDADHRVVQTHGGARLIAIGTVGGKEVFQLYERIALFGRLVERAPAGVDRDVAQTWVTGLADRLWFYFSTLNVLVAAVAIGTMLYLSGLPQRAEWPEQGRLGPPRKQPIAVAPIDLRAQLFDPQGTSKTVRQQAILIAASGGGTRAALYTASLLHGLYSVKALDKVVLASGVSGGGAALAYFAGHRDELRASDAAWTPYVCKMSEPFIVDVLSGIPESRILAGTRWGQLLAESFDRRFGIQPEQNSVGAVGDLALIFNTSLAGREYSDKGKTVSTSTMAGGRLIFTNLDRSDPFPGLALGLKNGQKVELDYVTVRDPIPLTTAAALNANFPPVFANAGVDVATGDRYWVTDGGAVDNRGIESLLFALRDAIKRELAQLDNGQTAFPTKPPAIHIIVAEASAGSTEFHQDRGVGSKFGAAEKFANQLMVELNEELKTLYGHIHDAGGNQGVMTMHYLAMPSLLRIGGGIGTHWMMPRVVTLRNPAGDDSISVDSAQARTVIEQLHQASDVPLISCPSDNDVLGVLYRSVFRNEGSLLTAKRWAAADAHRQVWRDLADSVRQ